MPIWIVKKILGYVDEVTLRRAKQVNHYWDWVITDLLEDKKIEIYLRESRKKIMVKFPNFIINNYDFYY